VAGDRGVAPGLALAEAEAVLAEREIFFYRPSEPGGADQPGLGQELPAGYPAVVEGQVSGPQVAADQQVVWWGGGGDPGPGIPALALGAVAGAQEWGFSPADITVPVLILHGDEDQMVPSAHGQWLAEHCPTAELRLAPGAGHITVLDSAPAALEWLRTQLPG
jgi:pimeloyl-ACP methyl ester carboxylesterase